MQPTIWQRLGMHNAPKHERRMADRKRQRRALQIETLETRALLASLIWSPSTPLATPRADAVAILTADAGIYVLGGNSDSVQVKLPGDTGWTNGPAIDKERIAPGAGEVGAGRILLFGGVSGGEAIEESYLYEPANVDPQDGASMSTTRAQGAFATDPLSGAVFAMGGINADTNVLNSVEKYYAGNWSVVAPLPTALADSTAAADGAGHFFVFGGRRAGYGSNDVTNLVYRYDVATNSWSPKANMPASLRDATAVTGPNNGKIYVFGGRSATGTVGSVYAYDFVANTWEVETSLLTPVADASATLDAEGHILVIGGRNAAGQIISSVQATQDLDSVDLIPGFISQPLTTATSTVPYSYQVVTSGNPQPTFALLSPPSGMTIDALGHITWTPNETHVGTQAITVRATNRAGATDQTFSIDVASAIPHITSTPVTAAGTSLAYQYQVQATGAPSPTFLLMTSIPGMAIDSTAGVISWTPADNQAGDFNVIVRATNSKGSHQQSFVISVADRSVPTTPTSLVMESVTLNSISLSWTGSTDNVGVTKYRLLEQYKYGWRSSRTGYRLVQDDIAGNSTTLGGLLPGKSYKLVVTAVDAAGNESLRSNLVLVTTLRLPTIYFLSGQTTNVAATHEMFPIQVYGSGVPSPTLSLVSGPTGMVFNPSTGVANWAPTDAQVGTHTAIFQATNSEGSAQVTATLTVRANLPVIAKSFTYFGTSWATPFAVEGDPFELQLFETFTNAPITWSLVSGPTGMNVDPLTGAVTWVPGAEHLGTASIVLRATNYAGSTDLPLSFDVLPLGTDLRAPTPVTGINVSVIDSTRALVSWAPSSDNVAVESYRITSTYRVRSGRFMKSITKTFTAAADETMLEMTGLNAHVQNLYIQAIDGSGNVSPVGQTVSFTPFANPTFPSLGIGGARPSNVVVGQNLQVQMADTNTTPRQYALQAAPAGMTVDSLSGLISWTPTYEQIGNSTITVRATNAFGYRDFTFTFPVAFTGAVMDVTYQRTGNSSGLASWTPPTDMTHVAGYFVHQTWSIGSRTYSHTYVVNSPTITSQANIFLVSGPVVHKIRVVAFDALGNTGLTSLSTSLV